MRRLAGPVLAIGFAAALLRAQQAGQQGQRCQLEILNVDREGSQVEIAPGVTNYFAGGNVRFRCRGQQIYFGGDSVAAYQGRVVQFIGRVYYRDSTVEMTASYGTYLRDNEKWEARENVVLRNLRDGSTLRGPMLDYYRVLAGVRQEPEMYADQRPTITLPAKDSLGRQEEPYVVVGDRVRSRGENRVWAAGRVTIDRSDFRGRADSLFLDTGPGNQGALVGNASTRRIANDSFNLVGRRIDLTFEEREISSVTARDSALLTSDDLRLTGDTIGLDLADRKVEQTLAWGRTTRPVALSTDYEVRGDSLAFDTPGQELREIRAFGTAWLGARPDSAGERDWVSGDSVKASFVPRDSAGVQRPTLQLLEARGKAAAFYRMQTSGESRPSLAYTKAALIRIVMRVADSVTVDSVYALGVTDGIHLQPSIARAADTTKADTTARRVDTLPPPSPRSRRAP